ncbi:MAG: hypothetical protein LBS20_06720 [Prevotella sp.]|jgi:hypothetical protein|nr:hypothetical protein [Prevotella sp.]
MSEKGKGSNKVAFDQEAINKLVGKKKEIPTQEVESGVVKEVLHNTMLQIPKSLFLEFKGNYLVKYDMTFRNFVINQMRKVLEEEKK